MPSQSDNLPEALRDRVLARLGLAHDMSVDMNGLRTLYAAWCAHVPFDNMRKLIALFSNPDDRLPGCDAVDFFEHFLANGNGGTCWPSSNALFSLVYSCGFDARRVAGSMRDVDMINHGSTKVRLDGHDWLIDSSILSDEPLPLGAELFVGSNPVFATEVEPVGDTHLVWFHAPPNPGFFPCRLLVDPADHQFYVDRYEASRQRSPFNQYVYARRNVAGAMVVVRGPTMYRKSARGIEQIELSRDELRTVLRDEIGFNETLIAQWIACGAMEASYQPPVSPPPPPVVALPPSQRIAS